MHIHANTQQPGRTALGPLQLLLPLLKMKGSLRRSTAWSTGVPYPRPPPRLLGSTSHHKAEVLLHRIHKNQIEMTKRPESIKFLEENTRRKLPEAGLDNDLWIPYKKKPKNLQKKRRKGGRRRRKRRRRRRKLCSTKETVNKIKRKKSLYRLGKVYAIHLSDIWLISKIHKEILQQNSRGKKKEKTSDMS